MKPTMIVSVGDKVKLGQALFEDKKTPGVMVQPHQVPGTVREINRGETPCFPISRLSSWNEGEEEQVEFPHCGAGRDCAAST